MARSANPTDSRPTAPSRRFVVLAAPRTGSNLVCTLLGSHPDVLCHHELFNPRGIRYALEHRDGSLDFGTPAERDAQPLDFLEKVWRNDLGHARVGFKITRGQNPLLFDAVLGDPSIRKIVVHRRNRVKTFVSEQIANAIDQWEVYDPSVLVQDRGVIQLHTHELRAHIAINEAFYAQLQESLAQTSQPWLGVVYEDLFTPTAQSAMLGFLGLTARPLRAASIKQNSRDLRQLVGNFDEAVQELAGSELEAELLDSND